MGHGTPPSWSLARTENLTLRHDLEGIPKALESFVVAISKHNQSTQHLKNVEADYEDMFPKYRDFPSFGTQKTTRLSQAQKDFDTAQAETVKATRVLLKALTGYFPEQTSPTSHQDCVSRSELDSIKDQFRTERHELEQLRSENHEMKRRLGKLEDRLNREVSAAKKSEDQILRLEDLSRTTTHAVNLATDNHKSLSDQTSKDRLSYRDRFSTLEVEMDKNKTRHKETSHAIDNIRSSLDSQIVKSNKTHQEQAQDIDLCKSRVEEMQQKLDVEVDSKLKHNSEILATTCKDVKELKERSALLSNPPVLCPPTTPKSIPTPNTVEVESRLKEAESRLKEVEKKVQGLDEEAELKNVTFADAIDKLDNELNNMQDNNGDKIARKQGLTEDELKNSTAWKDLKSRVDSIASNVHDLSANPPRIEDLIMSTKRELETSINEVKQVTSTSQGVLEALRPQVEYNSRTVENHIDVLTRHEVRLNSVTTDEVCRMMENQWRSAYGVPSELRGLSQRQAQLELSTRGRFDELNMKYEGIAADFRNRKSYPF